MHPLPGANIARRPANRHTELHDRFTRSNVPQRDLVPEGNGFCEFKPLRILTKQVNEPGAVVQHRGDVIIRVRLKAVWHQGFCFFAHISGLLARVCIHTQLPD